MLRCVATRRSLFLSCLHLWLRPSVPGIEQALSESTQGKEALRPGAVMVRDLEISWQLACKQQRGYPAEREICRDKGTRDMVTCPAPGTWWASQTGVSASPRETKGLCTRCCTPTLRSRQLPSLPPSLPRQRLPLGRCHIPGL